jgi:hypothetical protein
VCTAHHPLSILSFVGVLGGIVKRIPAFAVQRRATHPAGLIAMSERSFQQFAPLPQEPLAAWAPNPTSNSAPSSSTS